jgi:hypothetical protein
MGITKWEPWMDEVMREKFADTRNEELQELFGVSSRTLLRHARKLGLRKSEEYMDAISRKGLDTIEYKRMLGERVGGPKKGHGVRTSGSFKKGHRFEGEIEEKRVKAIRDRAWDERKRIIHGMPRKTRWKMLDFQN